MAFDVKVRTVFMISTHDIPNDTAGGGGVRYYNPSTVPNNFRIPSVDWDAERIDRECKLVLRDPARSATEDRIQYARLKYDKDGGRYILLEIPDSKAIRVGTEKREVDELNQPMNPQVDRQLLHINAAQVANEIETQFGNLGVITIKGDEPTDEEIRRSRAAFKQYVTDLLRQTGFLYERGEGGRAVTPLLLRFANSALKRGWITSLPRWAEFDVDPKQSDTFMCAACGTTLRKGAVRCSNAACGAIYDWKKAVELGLVAPRDVPAAKRTEAGLPDGDLFTGDPNPGPKDARKAARP